MTRPERYPGASTAYWWQDKWGGDPMDVNALVLHTLEGTGLPDYNKGSEAPNLTALPDMKTRRLVWYQHFGVDTSSRALVNKRGGVETNTLNVTQVELGGTCDDAHRGAWGSMLAGVDYVYWPEAPDWALADLARFVAWLHTNHGVPLTAPPVWLAYGQDPRRPGISPASYGPSPARMTAAQWNAFKGVCGHLHVPENDHGDPGAFPITKLLAMAAGSYTPEATVQPIDVWSYKNASQAKANPKLPDAYAYLQGVYNGVNALTTQVGQIVTRLAESRPVELTTDQIAAIGNQVAASPGLADRFAELVVEKLAARLQS